MVTQLATVEALLNLMRVSARGRTIQELQRLKVVREHEDFISVQRLLAGETDGYRVTTVCLRAEKDG
jgi:hypothetical protein